MNIKLNSLFNGVSIIAILLCIAIGVSLAIFEKKYNEAISKASFTSAVALKAFQLISLTGDYLLHHETRAIKQWGETHESLKILLESEAINQPEDSQDIQALQGFSNGLDQLFPVLIQAHTMSGSTANNSETHPMREKILASQILVIAHAMSSKATLMAKRDQQAWNKIMKVAQNVVIAFIVLLLTFSVIVLILYNRRIAKPIHLLRKDIHIIAGGTLEAKARAIYADEIGDVASDINSMQEALRKTLVSRDALTNEVAERKQAEERAREMAMIDQLTGLANRRQLQLQISQSIKLAKRENKSLALMMLDLDKFKPVNDSYGHLVGDAVLQAVASILVKHSRDSDFVARFGGDEFAILVIHPEGEAGVKKAAQRIIDDVKEPITIEGHRIQIGISIGISFYPADAENEEELMKTADLALYETKNREKGTLTFYHPEFSYTLKVMSH